MKYSIIIPYRDREKHLCILLPALVNHFKDKDYEVIVSEQGNNDSFCISAVQDIGFLHSKGETVIFQQVDYVPNSDVVYDCTNEYPVLPARRGIFVMEDNITLRPIHDIPAGYRNFHNEIDADFFGGVISMKRHHFEAINGYNPLIKSWGTEDDETRERFKLVNIPVIRNSVGTFTVLYHNDNNPELKQNSQEYVDFMNSRQILHKFRDYFHIGYKNLEYRYEKYEFDLPGTDKKGIWIRSDNYKVVGI